MMENHEETKRLRDAFATTSPEDVATPDCPPAEQIWEAVKNELGPSELRQVLHHIASCPSCTESWRLASRIEGDLATESKHSSDGIRKRRTFGWLGGVSAAAAVLAFFVVGPSLMQRFSTGSIARSGAAEELTLVTDNASLTRSECRPRWIAVEGATYDVQVLTESLELLTEEKGLSTPEFLVPEVAFDGLPAESVLLMRIEARKSHELPQSRTIRLPC